MFIEQDDDVNICIILFKDHIFSFGTALKLHKYAENSALKSITGIHYILKYI